MNPNQQAKAYALRQAGVKWENLAKWSDAERRAYLRAIGEFREKNPQMFSLAEQGAAKNYLAAAARGPVKISYLDATVDALGETLGDAGNSVAGVGQGIFATLKLGQWLIPAAAVAAVLVLLVALAKKTGAAK